MSLEQLCNHMQNKLIFISTSSHIKIYSKWTMDLNNASICFHMKTLEKVFVTLKPFFRFKKPLIWSSFIWKKKGKLTSFKFQKLKNTVKRMKRQIRACEKMFASHISDRGVVSSTYKEFSKLNNKESNNPIKNKQNI